MRISKSRTPGGRAVAAVLLALTGCGPAPETAPILRPTIENVTLGPTEQPLPRGPLFTPWLPDIGRAGDDVQARHLSPNSKWVPVLTENFHDASTEVVPGWRIIDFPSLGVGIQDGRKFLEIRGPADMKAPCGLECDLNTAAVAGHDVRLDLCFSCRSTLRAEVAQGIKIVVTAKNATGQTTSVEIPLDISVSPGWEWHHSLLRFESELLAATLRIVAERPVATATLSAVHLLAYQPDSSRSSPATGPASTQPYVLPEAEHRNWIDGGGFETGSCGFFAGAVARWPNGNERAVPLDWRFSQDAAEGTTALAISIPEHGGRIGFGPLNLDRTATLPPQVHLSFFAKAARPTTLTATLRTRSRSFDCRPFVLSSAWQRLRGSFEIDIRHADDRRELAAAELVFDYAGDRAPETNECGLDAVVLTDSLLNSPGLRSADVEIGILGPNPSPGDVRHLIDETAKASLSIKLVGRSASEATNRPATSQPAKPGQPRIGGLPIGQLAVDILDAWDRSVGRLTRPISLPPNGIVIENVSLEGLPRGYYRIVASLWEGTPGGSAMISQAASSLGILSWSDTIPRNNPYGLSTLAGNVSAMTTHLGAGWVRMDLPTKELQAGPGVWGFAAWGALLGACRANRIDVITALTLPSDAQTRQAFVEQWMAGASLWPSGVLVRRPSISPQSTEAYLAELRWLGEQLARKAPGIRLVSDSLVDGHVGNDAVLGISCPETSLPEECEKQLETIGHRQASGQTVWDLCVPVRLGGSQPLGTSPFTFATKGTGAVQFVEGPIDPVLSASRMIRSLLIRSLAGAQLACSEAVLLAPIRSALHDDCYRLHELDLSPRPALVAFDVLTGLLNNATLKRWVDVPGGTRVLYYESTDGRAVAAVWRPFGMSPTRLGLTGLAPSVTVVDCTGASEPAATEGALRVIEANEIVRFLIAAEQDRPALQQSLDSIRVLLDSQSLPAR